ncbi:tetratricopeptide repeat protein [Danxiaibacter flavus]|uniref:Tetratricopeptide repeat protein n=1 Tax=Danxiaibacter flavus TaxID=3049108 RepID=A0ABV3ZCP8_9BACT|nr:tetratricopeptide repeat protein [Chitinophagaceae bacterium DXS]
MSDKKVHEVGEEITHDPLLQVKGFWQRFQKPVLGVVIAAAVVGGGLYYYKNSVVGPKEEKAADAIYKAQEYFSVDSLQKALDGDGIGSKGFVAVAKEYSGTKAGNLAGYYAGISYLRLGQFDKAVKYLKDFSTDAKQVQMMAYGALGDAYSEQKKVDDAVSAYKKAAEAFDKDEVNASEYLFRAALLSESNGKTADALKLYKEVKEKFPNTDKGFLADKYIYRLSIEPNELSVK